MRLYDEIQYIMDEITKLLTSGEDAAVIISRLKDKAVDVPSWDHLKKQYEPSLHEICNDQLTRKDKIRSDGTKEVAARIYLGLEKLITSRMASFTFAIPVKRIYHNTENSPIRQEIAKAIERVYKHARIDQENIGRAKAYYAACEIFTIWYAVPSENTLYGFNSKYKIKCKTYSPMDGVSLYPLFDERDDLIAMSFEYKKKVLDNEITFFETYTAEAHYRWRQAGSGWEQDTKPEEITISKIPGIYACRTSPVYANLSHIRSEIEYTLSRNSDVIAYNSAPILKVAGSVQGVEQKGEARRVYRVENGGDVSYVSWSQAHDALSYHVDTLLDMFFMQSQMPDISFENMKSLGNIGYDARMTLLTDAHLKIGEESGAWIEYLERECNVIKAILAKANTKYASEIYNVEVEHIITPFVQNDEKSDIANAMAACGGKPVLSHLDGIKMAGLSSDPEATLKSIQEDEAAQTAARLTSMFNEGAE